MQVRDRAVIATAAWSKRAASMLHFIRDIGDLKSNHHARRVRSCSVTIFTCYELLREKKNRMTHNYE